MNPGAAGRNALLRTAYEQEAECYQRALQLAEDLPALLQQGQDTDEKLRQILTCCDEVKAIEARIAQTKKRWQDQDEELGPELQSVLDRVTELITRLGARIREAEQQAGMQKARLVPELDAAIRSRQMQQAYKVTPSLPKSP